ncbi:MAG: hypothetical protein A2Z20_12400 [Bdellovibrionales bacterium RBG_16_40_8]|nr:MAG: hypothetical protein A2Z20_12400 [Bdellovibrionales bacterium RBG_16_40_8]
MKWISFSMAILLIVSAYPTFADAPPSYRQQHPLAWMHGLPTGEQPGWSKPWWFNFEISNGNIWNAPLIMNDKKTGKQYKYTADFEQAHAIIELGRSIGQLLGISLEIPYAYRSGGLMDSTIDSFHVLIGNRRYLRNWYPKFKNIYSVKTDDVEYYSEDHLGDGVANLRLKIKLWFIRWLGKEKNSCPCGVAISSQTKFPVRDKKYAGTTGDIDQSVLLHMGVPLFSASSMWFTGGITYLGDNPSMKDWPRFKKIILYEGNFDFALTQTWGLILSARAESPFLDISRLEYFDTATSEKVISSNRAASGWHGLVHWRGTQSIGMRYRGPGGNLWQFVIAEDWGIGPYDGMDNIYSNNAPDINFIMQAQLKW